MIFPGGSVTPGSHRPIMSGSLIVSARSKIDTEVYDFILNTSKIAVCLEEFHYF